MSKWSCEKLEHILDELDEYQNKAGFIDEALDFYTIREFILNYLEQRHIQLENNEDD